LTNYKFRSVAADQAVPTRLRNTFVLKADGWDDYHSKIRFDLIHFDGTGARSNYGKVKILERMPYASTHIVKPKTDLPETFPELPDRYISLGQGEEYYQGLGRDFGTAEAVEVLRAMRDIALMPALAADFETHPPFRNGMVRTNEAQRAIRFGQWWVRGEEVQFEPAFTYAPVIGGGEVPTVARFDLAQHDYLPHRVTAIIGRNAVGKTAFMSQLAADLSQIDRISEERLTQKGERFPDRRPIFARIIAVSYSAFDRFRRPEPTPFSSYVYCGIRDERGSISQRALSKSYNLNRRRIREHGREEDWIEYVLQILGTDQGLSEDRLRREIGLEGEEEQKDALLDELSSGQAILCHFVTAVLAWIRSETLILFDEPETHLHPNAVGNLFLVLTKILQQFRSYSIVATHSPVVLQEVPSKRVLHFVRDGNTTVADPLAVESFGESVTELTRHVFGTIEVESLYKHVLRDLARTKTPEEVLDLFPKGLSLAAQAYLAGLYGSARKK
jgi:predicted ATPase